MKARYPVCNWLCCQQKAFGWVLHIVFLQMSQPFLGESPACLSTALMCMGQEKWELKWDALCCAHPVYTLGVFSYLALQIQLKTMLKGMFVWAGLEQGRFIYLNKSSHFCWEVKCNSCNVILKCSPFQLFISKLITVGNFSSKG